MKCATGYTAVIGGYCRLNPGVERPDCDCDEDGRVNPKVGQPIVVSTGAKILSAEDFETADGKFRLGRKYRSFQVGRPIDSNILPRALPRGLAGGWNFDFGYEIQLKEFSGTPSSPSAKLAVLAPDGTGYGFVLQSSGQWVFDPSFGAANAPSNMKLEFVGTLPADLATINGASNTWKLTDADDTVWTIKTFTSPNGGGYLTGWPTKKVARDGYTWNFTYNSDSSLASIADSFGRAANFSWYKFYISSLASPPAGSLPYPQAVSSIALPDGTSLRYTYDPAPATSAPSTSAIKRLTKVERRNAANAVLDSVQYLYEDSRFPTFVTGIKDNTGSRIRTYAYDTQGRATTSKNPDGTDAYTVQYGTNGTALTRRVINPLGKGDYYTYSSFSGGLSDYRLTQLAGKVSASTPASTTSVNYAASTFISSQTDANGRSVTKARDAKGRPLTIVEASGTPNARTTTICAA